MFDGRPCARWRASARRAFARVRPLSTTRSLHTRTHNTHSQQARAHMWMAAAAGRAHHRMWCLCALERAKHTHTLAHANTGTGTNKHTRRRSRGAHERTHHKRTSERSEQTNTNGTKRRPAAAAATNHDGGSTHDTVKWNGCGRTRRPCGGGGGWQR